MTDYKNSPRPLNTATRPKRKSALIANSKIKLCNEWENCSEDSEMFKAADYQMNAEFERETKLANTGVLREVVENNEENSSAGDESDDSCTSVDGDGYESSFIDDDEIYDNESNGSSNFCVDDEDDEYDQDDEDDEYESTEYSDTESDTSNDEVSDNNFENRKTEGFDNNCRKGFNNGAQNGAQNDAQNDNENGARNFDQNCNQNCNQNCAQDGTEEDSTVFTNEDDSENVVACEITPASVTGSVHYNITESNAAEIEWNRILETEHNSNLENLVSDESFVGNFSIDESASGFFSNSNDIDNAVYPWYL